MSVRGSIAILCCLLLFSSLPGTKGETGPQVTTDRDAYTYADANGVQQVRITFFNGGSAPVYLSDYWPYHIDDDQGTVFTPGGLAEVIQVMPGESVNRTWSYQTNCSGLSDPSCAGVALPGSYSLTWSYELEIGGQASEVVAHFRIGN